MRVGLLVLAVGVGVGLSHEWLARAWDQATDAALTEEARLALELGCRGSNDRAVRQCRSTLKKLYLAGSLDPDRTLRAYCDEVRTARWGGSRPPPPEVCVQRYGGWRQS